MDIRELARRTGVSVATVSRALNDRPDVSPATRARIVAMARELGYRPNHQARSLVRRRSGLIGLLWNTAYAQDGARHPFLADVLIGLKAAVAGSGYHLMIVSVATGEDDDEGAYVHAARQHGLEGLVLMGMDPRSAAVEALLASGCPCVGVDLLLQGPAARCVTSDNRSGAASAVAHLHALGHRRIATITGPPGMWPADERLAGYRQEIERAGSAPRPEYVESGDFFQASGYDRMRRLLALAQPPTAVFVAGDEMAVGAMHAAADTGLRVPDDVSVVGFDDVDAATLVRPALTTVAQDRMALAAAAVAELSDLIDAGGPPAPGAAVAADGTDGARPLRPPLLLPTRLVVRDSCAPPGTNHHN